MKQRAVQQATASRGHWWVAPSPMLVEGGDEVTRRGGGRSNPAVHPRADSRQEGFPWFQRHCNGPGAFVAVYMAIQHHVDGMPCKERAKAVAHRLLLFEVCARRVERSVHCCNHPRGLRPVYSEHVCFRKLQLRRLVLGRCAPRLRLKVMTSFPAARTSAYESSRAPSQER